MAREARQRAFQLSCVPVWLRFKQSPAVYSAARAVSGVKLKLSYKMVPNHNRSLVLRGLLEGPSGCVFLLSMTVAIAALC